jgi:transcription initiation factor TFIIIB Brf1 subunit/transcription initiation factor TFIIB
MGRFLCWSSRMRLLPDILRSCIVLTASVLPADATAGVLTHQDGAARALQGISNIPSTTRIRSANDERLQAALSYLELPRHVAKAAKQLLPLVIQANAAATPRRNTTAATVAATVYMAAREERHALPLGRAGAALSVYGVHVGKEYR